jgi:hypothetical protein
VSQTPPLPSSALEYWHGELGASAANAIGRIAGYTLPGQSSPTVATDGALFNGRTVYKATEAGACWYGNPSILVAAGGRPYLYVIGRFRSVPGSQRYLCGLAKHFAANVLSPFSNFASANALTVEFGGTAFAYSQVNGTTDTNVHRFEAWLNGANKNFRIDGVNASAANGDTLLEINAVAIGYPFGVSANSSIAFMLVCSAVPSAGEIAALNAWATAYWGAP